MVKSCILDQITRSNPTNINNAQCDPMSSTAAGGIVLKEIDQPSRLKGKVSDSAGAAEHTNTECSHRSP